ncbi:Flp family type IVb pilin [Aromatoleum toluclasticum]|uniref:Flp family type IVb pilin n=1 Tax=Aromatoleum toluclasticum TaxID=92003 RepID=UPI001D198272|nr:Flp family type IVb pilin [Aromatoleum toluclasticum]MCC4115638.1 Flp family type IVb pilin [Aromatoleum toluclasticum]
MRLVQLKRNAVAFMNDERGVTAIEYALLAALIFSVIVIAVTTAGTSLAALYSAVAAAIPSP